MKRSISFLFVLFIAFIAMFVAAPYKTTSSEGMNLLYNGNFNEVETIEDVMSLVGWTKAIDNLKVVEITDSNYYAQSKNKGPDKEFCIYQSGLDLEAGKYNLEFKARITNGSCNIEVGLRTDTDHVIVHKEKFIENYSEFTSVSIDLELPDSGVYEFYFKATKLGEKIAVDDMVLSLIGGNALKTASGADLRTVKSSAGLRFKGSVDKNLFDGYVSKYGAENVQVGILIAPADFIKDCEFTCDLLATNKAVACVATFWNNTKTIETDGYYGFNCAFINILPYNTDRKFSFRSFLRYTDGTKTEYLYSDYDETENSISVYELALALHERESEFLDYQVEIIDYFCNLIEYPTQSVSVSGNTFSLTFSNIKGYFVLDYDRTAYSLSNVKIAVGSGAEKDFSGMELLPEITNITITFTVDTAENLNECPVRGKIYKTD